MLKHLVVWAGMAAAWAGNPAQATVTLPALISDHMVLQRSDKTALWGTASPGEKVTATLNDVEGETAADPDGHWHLTLDLSHEKDGPFDLIITGENRIVISDVLIGEVWLTAGQSNMGFLLSETVGAKEEMASSSNPQLRQFLVERNPAPEPVTTLKGQWTMANPAQAGGFSAVGYYFGKNLQQTLHTPVAIINSSWGGTSIESWTSLPALQSDPDLRESLNRRLTKAAAYDAALQTYLSGVGPWMQKFGRTDHPTTDSANFPPGSIPDGCTSVTLPGKLGTAGLPDAGAIWLWKKVTLDASVVGTNIPLSLGTPAGFETVYWNGNKLGERTPLDTTHAGQHVYYVTPTQVDNVLAVRLYCPAGGAGITADRNKLAIGTQPLQGTWMAKAEYDFPSDTEATQTFPRLPDVDEPWNRPAYLYNGMINPLLLSAIRGVVWYQGENNTGRAAQYATLLPLMIQDWRSHWSSRLPFYICQLPNYMAKKQSPSESAWAELREAQAKALSLPDSNEAVLIDLGEEGTVHPRDKREVGRRVALLALAHIYGQAVPSSGPIYDSYRIEGNKIRIFFRKDAGHLVAKPLPDSYQPLSSSPKTVPLVRNSPDSSLEGFAICGADHHWVWAEAAIDGDSVVVQSPAVSAPVAVRYAWADNPTCNLYNQAGLPAMPFRTDDFPLSTLNAKY